MEQRPGSEPLAGALIGGMIAAFFSLGGWWDVSKLAGEVRDPGRTLPQGPASGRHTGHHFVYILISLVFLYLVPPERIDSRETFAALAGEALFGRAGGVVLSLIVIVTVLGSLAAALDGDAAGLLRHGPGRPVLPAAAAAFIPRYHTPARAIVIQAVLASLLAVLGTFDEILAYFIVPTVLFVGLTVAAVFVLGRRARNTGEEPVVGAMAADPAPALPGPDRISGRAPGHEQAETCRDRPGCGPAGTSGLPSHFHQATSREAAWRCLEPCRTAGLGRRGDDLTHRLVNSALHFSICH